MANLLSVDFEIVDNQIIEIGIYDVNKQRTYQSLVRPTKSQCLSDYFWSEFNRLNTELDWKLTEKDLKTAPQAHEVVNQIYKEFGADNDWFAWGQDNVVIKQLHHEVYKNTPLIPERFFNFGFIYHQFTGLTKKTSLSTVFEKEFNYSMAWHRALPDAIACGDLYQKLRDINQTLYKTNNLSGIQ